MAVFGAQQSPLEALLLKRRIMGPSWLKLAQPVRVDGGVQARAIGNPKVLVAQTLPGPRCRPW